MTEKKDKDNFAAVDVGNSRIKVLIDGETISFEIKESWVEKFSSFISKIDNHYIIGISSVNEKVNAEILKILHSNEITNSLPVPELLDEQEIIDFSNVSGMGTDRKLGIAGAAAEAEPPFITVDCGTAVTVNALDEGNICLGGAIFPGLHTQIRALHEFTSALPCPEYRKTNAAAGRNTEEAILSGSLHSVAGGIIQLVRNIELQEFAGISVPVYVTGGYAEEVIPFLKGHLFPLILNKSLVSDGILFLLKNLKK